MSINKTKVFKATHSPFSRWRQIETVKEKIIEIMFIN
jgi:hypothetical protein